MSKTIDLQIEKCRQLVDGFRRNLQKLSDKGVTESQLDELSKRLDELKKANDECEAIRKELTEKVRQMNVILLDVKEEYQAKKRLVKGYYPMDEWIDFGIPDKR